MPCTWCLPRQHKTSIMHAPSSLPSVYNPNNHRYPVRVVFMTTSNLRTALYLPPKRSVFWWFAWISCFTSYLLQTKMVLQLRPVEKWSKHFASRWEIVEAFNPQLYRTGAILRRYRNDPLGIVRRRSCSWPFKQKHAMAWISSSQSNHACFLSHKVDQARWWRHSIHSQSSFPTTYPYHSSTIPTFWYLSGSTEFCFCDFPLGYLIIVHIPLEIFPASKSWFYHMKSLLIPWLVQDVERSHNHILISSTALSTIIFC